MKQVSGVHLWLLLWKTTRALEAHAERSIAGAGMCLSDFAILEALLHKGPLSIKSLGEKVLLTSGSITTAVDRVEKRGWVRRGEDARDRRVKIVTLTEGGREVIRRAFARHERDMEKAVAGFKMSERSALAALLRRLGRGAVDLERSDKKEERGK